jgi:hypothetical protein
LPTFIETQKTFDHKIFYKSGDIGQMLYVFDTKVARDAVKRKETIERHSETYYLHGLSAPTHNIVKSRFELTQKSSDSYPVHKVRAVVNDIAASWTTDERPVGRAAAIIGITEGSSSSSSSGAGGGAVDFVEITEEVVDFEEWMVDPDSNNPDIGVTYRIEHWDGNLGLLLEHPEILNGPDEGNVYVTK